METVALHLAHRWYLGYRLDERLPDHSSLTRIRLRLGLPIFERFFAHVVELCQQAGLVWGKELFFDATKVRADAAVDSLVPRRYADAKAHLDGLFADTAAVAATAPAGGPEGATAPAPGASEPAKPEDASGTAAVAVMASGEPVAPHAPTLAANPDAPTSLPFAGTAEQEQHLATENQVRWKLLEAHGLDPNRPPSPGRQRCGVAVRVVSVGR